MELIIKTQTGNRHHKIKFNVLKLVELLDDYGIDAVVMIKEASKLRTAEEIIAFVENPHNILKVSTILQVLSGYELKRDDSELFGYFRSHQAILDVVRCWNESIVRKTEHIDDSKQSADKRLESSLDFITMVDKMGIKLNKDFSDFSFKRIFDLAQELSSESDGEKKPITKEIIKSELTNNSDEDLINALYD